VALRRPVAVPPRAVAETLARPPHWPAGVRPKVVAVCHPPVKRAAGRRHCGWLGWQVQLPYPSK